jgi:hypothetical protein
VSVQLDWVLLVEVKEAQLDLQMVPVLHQSDSRSAAK